MTPATLTRQESYLVLGLITTGLERLERNPERLTPNMLAKEHQALIALQTKILASIPT